MTACLLSACQGASSATGLDAMLRAQGAQVVSGDISAAPEDQAESQVSGLSSPSNLVYPGLVGRTVTGKVGPDASAVAIGLAGENLFWVIPAGLHDPVRPELLQFSTELDFSRNLADSSLLQQDEQGQTIVPVVFRAVTPDGRLGPSTVLGMRLVEESPSGSLVISLRWRAPVDFDLRVIAPLPDGSGTVEIWSKHGSNQPAAKGTAPASKSGVGTLDLDSDAACDIDGRNQENVVWKDAPPPGHYIVRVDAFSLCGQVSADWEALATYNGEVFPKDDENPADVFGVATDASTRGTHGAGAGVTAFEFDLQ